MKIHNTLILLDYPQKPLLKYLKRLYILSPFGYLSPQISRGRSHAPQNIFDIHRMEEYAISHPDMLCSEVHKRIFDVAEFHDGVPYDKHGSLTCKRWSFKKDDIVSMLIIHHSFFSSHIESINQHSNIFMYIDPDDKSKLNKSLVTYMTFVKPTTFGYPPHRQATQSASDL